MKQQLKLAKEELECLYGMSSLLSDGRTEMNAMNVAKETELPLWTVMKVLKEMWDAQCLMPKGIGSFVLTERGNRIRIAMLEALKGYVQTIAATGKRGKEVKEIAFNLLADDGFWMEDGEE